MIRGVLFLAALAWITMVTSMIAITVCGVAAARHRLPAAPRVEGRVGRGDEGGGDQDGGEEVLFCAAIRARTLDFRIDLGELLLERGDQASVLFVSACRGLVALKKYNAILYPDQRSSRGAFVASEMGTVFVGVFLGAVAAFLFASVCSRSKREP